MKMDPKTAQGFSAALNEATLLGAEYDSDRNLLGTTFSVLTLPGDRSPEPADSRVQIVFSEVGRVAAALRSDLVPDTIPFQIAELPEVVKSFGGQPVYGWDFVNTDDSAFTQWKERLSLDFCAPSGSSDNQIHLFQVSPGSDRQLDLWIWFEAIHLRNPQGDELAMEDFIAGGERWWAAMYAGDQRASGHGIVPAGDRQLDVNSNP